MVYITGDTHLPIDKKKLYPSKFSEQKTMTKDDILIICGDFGGVWDGKYHDKQCLDWMQDKNFTTAFVAGNHENYSLLNKYPVIEWNGGKVHQIRKSIFYLINGEIYTIQEKKFFVMGGATSHDKYWRIPGISWWAEEIPSKKERDYAIENLKSHDNKVDYIVTHCAPTFIQKKLNPSYKKDLLTDYFTRLYRTVSFEKWYCGHYHEDFDFPNEHVFVRYHQIDRIV